MVILGIDEVGRGCWAGPMVVGAVVLACDIAGLRDSKKLSPAKRKLLDAIIRTEARDCSLGWVSAQEIDILGLTKALKLAIDRALSHISVNYDQLIIDGTLNFYPDNPRSLALVKADDQIPAVSAASIIAKVARDNYMIQAAETYPQYGFDKHVGYGTKLHQQALQLHGISALHRRSYKPIKALAAG